MTPNKLVEKAYDILFNHFYTSILSLRLISLYVETSEFNQTGTHRYPMNIIFIAPKPLPEHKFFPSSFKPSSLKIKISHCRIYLKLKNRNLSPCFFSSCLLPTVINISQLEIKITEKSFIEN